MAEDENEEMIEIYQKTPNFEITYKVNKKLVEEYGGIGEVEELILLNGLMAYGNLLAPHLKAKLFLMDSQHAEEKFKVVIEDKEDRKKLENLIN